MERQQRIEGALQVLPGLAARQQAAVKAGGQRQQVRSAAQEEPAPRQSPPIRRRGDEDARRGFCPAVNVQLASDYRKSRDSWAWNVTQAGSEKARPSDATAGRGSHWIKVQEHLDGRGFLVLERSTRAAEAA